MIAYDECRTCHKSSPTTQDRYSLGLYAGHMCDGCWKTSGYRNEPASAFDPSYAGESYDDD